MIIDKWIILIVSVIINSFISPIKLCSSANQQFQSTNFNQDERADGVKSGALNNFLASVLRAKDELNWIDRRIYSRTSGHKLREVRRKLFWSDNSSLEKKKNVKMKIKKKNVDDLSDEISFELNDNDNYEDENVKNKIKQLQKHKQKRLYKLNKPLIRSISNNHDVNNLHAVKRRYPIINNPLTGFGIEYFDYEINIDKRDLSDNAAITTENSEETESISSEEQKKIDDILKMYEENNAATYKSPKEKYLNDENTIKSSSSKSKNIVSKRQNDKLSEDNEVNSMDYDLINDNDANVDGHQATYNRNEDDEINSTVQDLKIISNIKNSIVTDNHQLQLRKLERNIFNRPNVSSKIIKTNLSLSDNNYEDLKATDDLFKGGIEQDNNNNEIPIALLSMKNNSDNIKNNLIKYKKYPINKKLNHNKSEREVNLKSFKGSIIHHESIVESSNWPWEYYDEKDDTGILFGRRLMQSLNKPKIIKKHQQLIQHNNEYSKNNLTRSFSQSINNKNFNTQDNSSERYLAISGKLAKQIVNKIFEKINQNDKLKMAISINEKKSSNIDKITNNTPLNLQTKNQLNTNKMIRKISELLSQIVVEEMGKKTCTKLSPELNKFLQCMVENEDNSIDIREFTRPSSIATDGLTTTSEENNTKYSFPISTIPMKSYLKLSSAELDEIYRKIRLLNGLIKEYHLLSSKERTKVQVIHDYLERQLNLLINYEKLREKSDNNILSVTQIPERIKHNSRSMFNDVNNFISTSIISGTDKKKRSRRRIEKIHKTCNDNRKILRYRRSSMMNFLNNLISEKTNVIYPIDIKLFPNNTLNLTKLSEHCSKNKSILEEMIGKNDRKFDKKLISNNSIEAKNLSSIDELNIIKNISTVLLIISPSSYNSIEQQKITTEKKIMNNKSEFNQEQETPRQIIESKINVFPVD